MTRIIIASLVVEGKAMQHGRASLQVFETRPFAVDNGPPRLSLIAPQGPPSSSVAAFYRRSFPTELLPHVHPHPELTLILKGQGLRRMDDSCARFSAGDLCLAPEGTSHAWAGSASGGDDVLALVIHFSRTALGPALVWPELENIRLLCDGARGGVTVRGKTRDAVEAELLKLVAEPVGSWRRVIRLHTALGMIANSDDVFSVGSASAASKRPRTDPRLHAILKYVDQCAAGAISHTDAARAAGMGLAAFKRFFKQALGRSFRIYVNEIRIARACNVMSQPKRPVGDIGAELGFRNSAQFHRQFQLVKGMAPSQYRRSLEASVGTTPNSQAGVKRASIPRKRAGYSVIATTSSGAAVQAETTSSADL